VFSKTIKEKNMLSKSTVKTVFAGALFAAVVGLGAAKANAQDNNNPWVQAATEDGTYCHLKFPAVRQSTLNTDRPQLKTGSGDLVDFYGPCSHDPLSADEITSQRNELNLQWEMNYESE
jgi:hypothetical protein